MGGGEAAGRRVFRRRTARATASTARCLPSATRSSRSIPSRARRPKSFADSGFVFSGRVRDAEARFARSEADAVVPLDRRRAAGRRPRLCRPGVRRGISHRSATRSSHKAIRTDAPGYVEVWPSLGADAVEEPDDWTQADRPRQGAGGARCRERRGDHRRLARRPARSSKGTGRRLTAGDMLVLVRKRDRFVHALTASLKQPRHSGRRRRPAEPARPYRRART